MFLYSQVRIDPRNKDIDLDSLMYGRITPLSEDEMKKQEGDYVYRYRYNGGGATQVWLSSGRYGNCTLFKETFRSQTDYHTIHSCQCNLPFEILQILCSYEKSRTFGGYKILKFFRGVMKWASVEDVMELLMRATFSASFTMCAGKRCNASFNYCIRLFDLENYCDSGLL